MNCNVLEKKLSFLNLKKYVATIFDFISIKKCENTLVTPIKSIRFLLASVVSPLILKGVDILSHKRLHNGN